MATGYWRSGIYSENIYFCENFEEECKLIFFLKKKIKKILSGGENEDLCKFGHIGPLCSCCLQGFSKQGSNSCVECSSGAINLISILGIFAIFLLFLLIMILFN